MCFNNFLGKKNGFYVSCSGIEENVTLSQDVIQKVNFLKQSAVVVPFFSVCPSQVGIKHSMVLQGFKTQLSNNSDKDGR